jgi:hypothetical protein
MRSHTRELKFAKMVTSQPVSAQCSACKRVFVAKPGASDRTDDLALRIKAEFDRHDCNEDASQAAARIVKEATKNQ